MFFNPIEESTKKPTNLILKKVVFMYRTKELTVLTKSIKNDSNDRFSDY